MQDSLPTSGSCARDRLDPRIEDAIAVLHGLDPHDRASAAQLSALVGLSPSRFLHLFRDHTGTSFRRYRLWLRMLRVAERVQDGTDLTGAAMDAGFASPSHFSDSFHAMFGLPPATCSTARSVSRDRPSEVGRPSGCASLAKPCRRPGRRSATGRPTAPRHTIHNGTLPRWTFGSRTEQASLRLGRV